MILKRVSNAGGSGTIENTVTITPVVAGVPVAAEMESVAIDWSDVIVQFNLVAQNGATAIHLTFYQRTRETQVIDIYPSGVFQSIEVAGNTHREFFIEPRPVGMIMDLWGVRIDYVGGPPTVSVFMRARK